MMDEELKPSEETTSNVQTETSSEVEKKEELESLPRLEDLLKSEKEVKKAPEIKGVKVVEQKIQTEDRVFTRKSDEKKAYMKKRFNIVKSVYLTAVSLMVAFMFINIGTMVVLNKDITTNTATKQAQQAQIEVLEQQNQNATSIGDVTISLNEPRDYSDDKKDLTFLDKVTILFRNIFS